MLSTCPRCEVDLDRPYKVCPECGFNLEDYLATDPLAPRPTPPRPATATAPPMPPKVAPSATLMYCSDCGKQVSRLAAACPHCGRPINAVPPMPPTLQRPWYFHGLLITLLLFTFSPLGILLMWMQKPRSAFFGGFVTRFLITIIFGLGWLIGFAAMQADPSAVQVMPRTGSTNPGAVTYNPLAAPVVTLAEFNQLQNGMSYEQAKAIIGAEGSVMSQSHIDGIQGVMASVDTVMYGWQNQDASNMNAMFQNNKLISKSQLGLK